MVNKNNINNFDILLYFLISNYIDKHITIRKYHIDYLLQTTVHNKNIDMEFVIYIEDFGEDNKHEAINEKKFERIREMKIFQEKIPSILVILNKMNISEKFSEESFPTFTAKNFASNLFVHYPLEESNVFIDGAFCRNKFFLNYLVKRKELVSNQLSAFDEKKEAEIVQKQNAYDYEIYFQNLPSIKDKLIERSGGTFDPLPSNLEFNRIHNEVKIFFFFFTFFLFYLFY
jgi:hypothetical protein